jgi:hypothetical protein
MLSKKYLIVFFGSYILILSFFLFFLIRFVSRNPLEFFNIFGLAFFVVGVSITAVVVFKRNVIYLNHLSPGIYTAKGYWTDETGNIFIVCCKGKEFVDFFAKIIWAKKVDFSNETTLSSFSASLEKNAPVYFFLTKYKKAKKMQIYLPEAVLNVNKYDQFVLD